MSKKEKQLMPKVPAKSFDQTVKEMDVDPQEFEQGVARVAEAIMQEDPITRAIPGDNTTELKEQVMYDGTEPDPSKIPDWVVMPEGFQLPAIPDICFMRFRAKWTYKPQLGDRTLILWPLSLADEQKATKRARGDSEMVFMFQSLQCVRVIDGMIADWTGVPKPGQSYNVLKFADEIGKKCRHMIENYYGKVHMMDGEEITDFFANCFTLRTGQGG